MKKILTGFLAVIKFPYNVVKLLCHYIVKCFTYVYTASDYVVKETIDHSHSLIAAYKTKDDANKEYKIARKVLWTLIILGLLALLSYFAEECVYFVPVGGGAVVTRFGAFNRETGMGVHFRIPLIERYYVVNVGFLKQENFGFIQVNPPIRHQGLLNEERKAQTLYEKELLAKEGDNDVFAEKGDILSALEQRQRLTHDYLREIHGYNKTLTGSQALALLERNRREINALTDRGISVNGRIPLRNEARLITKELNLINIRWSLQFRIRNMRKYLFDSRDVQENIQKIGFSAMSEVIGDSAYDSILTNGRKKIEDKVRQIIQLKANKLGLGLRITQVIIIEATPVEEVKHAFDEVNKATQDKERIIYDAQRLYFEKIPEAKGNAKKIILEAQAYALKVRNLAEGKADQFLQLLSIYDKAPNIVYDRLYINAMDSFLKASSMTIIDPRIQGVLPIFTGNGLSGLKKKIFSPQESLKTSATLQGENTNTKLEPAAPIKPVTKVSSKTQKKLEPQTITTNTNIIPVSSTRRSSLPDDSFRSGDSQLGSAVIKHHGITPNTVP